MTMALEGPLEGQFTHAQLLVLEKMRRYGTSLEEARAEVVQAMRSFGVPNPVDQVDEAIQGIQKEAARRSILDRGVTERRQAIEGDLREGSWYVGPMSGDKHWPALRQRLEDSSMAEALPDLDRSSTQVVAQFAQPGVVGLKKRGLVLGYVQSGKTANYTAVMAKAADAGYKTFIVMSGVHNNLRLQTQTRIDRDLNTKNWHRLTTEEGDFGNVPAGNAALGGGLLNIAVVKKNAARLRRLRDWLSEIDPEIRQQSPILILDDEADQATPNSLAAREKKSVINALIRDIWAEVHNGTYVGYTATPFANIFMDPDDEEELFPADFILNLPRSGEYFGAERIFGRASLDSEDQPDPGLDMVREVPSEDAESLRPPSDATARAAFDPEIPSSLEEAARWFLLATAIRRSRGQTGHSSMLVHTSQYVDAHFAMQNRLDTLISEFASEVEDERLDAFEEIFADETTRVSGVSPFPAPNWTDVAQHLGQAAADLRTVADNGRSLDRLNYARTDEHGKPKSEVVIAVGGGTLSRGLTLEGLCVSFFTRTANTYDTLLQMGRWFGYRPGYEDLPRIWMPADLNEDFQFLALVEEELRRDMLRLTELNVTPQQFGLRVRAHPGRLSITSRAKMAHAEKVRLSYAGQRHQTIVLYETDTDALHQNLTHTRTLISDVLRSKAERVESTPERTIFTDVEASAIRDYISRFRLHPDQPGLRADHVVGWLKGSVPSVPWNVVVRGTSTESPRNHQGEPIELGRVDLGLGYDIPMVNRSPLSNPDRGVANIKALLSQSDWTADFRPADRVELLKGVSGPGYRTARQEAVARQYSADAVTPAGSGRKYLTNGLLVIYVVSPHSQPMRATQVDARRAMKADTPIVALGFIFPDTPEAAGPTGEGDYYTVRPDWVVNYDDVDEIASLDSDTEGPLGGPGPDSNTEATE